MPEAAVIPSSARQAPAKLPANSSNSIGFIRMDSECERPSALEQVGELIGRQGFAEQIALHSVATMLTQELALGAALDPLRHRGHLEIAGQPDDRGDDGGVVDIQTDVTHEGLVDLDLVEVESP